jgi:hypothetical protein
MTKGTVEFKAEKFEPLKADWQLYEPSASVMKNSPFASSVFVLCMILMIHQLVSIMEW